MVCDTQMHLCLVSSLFVQLDKLCIGYRVMHAAKITFYKALDEGNARKFVSLKPEKG